jgi:hypothetical protein
MNKRLLISKSYDNSNRCTPYRGKPDQHNTYASYASPCTPDVCFMWAVPIHGNLSRQRQMWMDPTAPEKMGSRHNPQHAGWPIHGSVPSFSPKPSNEAVDLSQASVDDKLLGLLDPYHQHAIGTFNTCSQGPTHRSLTDTGGGYNLGGADFLHTSPRPSQLVVSPFHLRAPPSEQETIMRIFVQANYHVVHMHAKMQCMDMHRYL